MSRKLSEILYVFLLLFVAMIPTKNGGAFMYDFACYLTDILITRRQEEVTVCSCAEGKLRPDVDISPKLWRLTGRATLDSAMSCILLLLHSPKKTTTPILISAKGYRPSC